MILEGAIGGIIGGVFRLAPELMKVWDRKNERAHEATMMDKEIAIAEKRLDHEMKKVDAAMTMAELDAVSKAITEQGQTARAAGKFVAAISALVRPLVTYWFVFMYSAVKVVGMSMAVDSGAAWDAVLVSSWTGDDASMLSMTVSFWFLDRTMNKRSK
jgi:hypothetical protein